MILPDVNVLIYAFRADAARHALCKSWLEVVVNDPAPFGISPLVLAAVTRITTDRRIFPQPSGRDEAFAFGNALLAKPNRQIVEPGDRRPHRAWSPEENELRSAARAAP